MKKAKMMLTAIAVLTIAGGTLAFKAHKAFNGSYVCRTLGSSEGVCPSATFENKYKQNAGGILQFCNNGSGSTTCNNQIRVTQDDN